VFCVCVFFLFLCLKFNPALVLPRFQQINFSNNVYIAYKTLKYYQYYDINRRHLLKGISSPWQERWKLRHLYVRPLMTMETVSSAVYARRHCYVTTCCVIYVIALLTGLTSCIQSNVSHRRISHSASILTGTVLAAEAARTDGVAVSSRIGCILHALRCLLEARRGVLEYSRRTAVGSLIATAVIPLSYKWRTHDQEDNERSCVAV